MSNYKAPIEIPLEIEVQHLEGIARVCEAWFIIREQFTGADARWDIVNMYFKEMQRRGATRQHQIQQNKRRYDKENDSHMNTDVLDDPML